MTHMDPLPTNGEPNKAHLSKYAVRTNFEKGKKTPLVKLQSFVFAECVYTSNIKHPGMLINIHTCMP